LKHKILNKQLIHFHSLKKAIHVACPKNLGYRLCCCGGVVSSVQNVSTLTLTVPFRKIMLGRSVTVEDCQTGGSAKGEVY